ncbi:MAG: hypothetical protein U0175_36420 [Caldilineaceae bacterium]
MARKVQNVSQPPAPPPFPRQIQLRPVQWIGIPVLLLIPFLALFGVFGESFETLQANNKTLSVEVTYPNRFRYQMYDSMEVTVHNLSPQPISTVEVLFAKDYIDQFDNVDFTPRVGAVEDGYYVVELHDLAAQQTQAVNVDLQADKAWRHAGEIMISIVGSKSINLNLVTWVFP